MEFIGRHQELSRLKRELRKDGQNTVLVYGRRRVGKSELIKQALAEVGGSCIYYECKETTEADNVKTLAALVSEMLGYPRLSFSGIEELLDFLFGKALEKHLVIVLDEYPYLRKSMKGLDSVLQSLLDKYRSTSKASLILCGSYVEVMKSLLEESNPLYGRVDLAINLKPMDYYDSALFYPNFSAEDKVRLFSVFGGIPHYNRLINQSLTVRENVIDLVAEPGARLENEVSMYLSSEIAKMTNANEVFGALAQGYSKYKDVLDQSHVSSGPAMVDVLDKLIGMELVQKQTPINDPRNKKKSSYHIVDRLSLFYYRYLFQYASQRSFLDPEMFFDRYIAEDFEKSYVPHAFEEVCKQYLIRKNKAGKMPEPFDLIGRYWYDDPVAKTNGEFDVVTKDPKGYVFYEAKFRKSPITSKMIEAEIAQVKATGLECYRYGFISRSGFSTKGDGKTTLIDIDELYA